MDLNDESTGNDTRETATVDTRETAAVMSKIHDLRTRIVRPADLGMAYVANQLAPCCSFLRHQGPQVRPSGDRPPRSKQQACRQPRGATSRDSLKV